MIYNNITELIGRTPLVSLKRIAPELDAEIIAKIEFFNPGGSIKDRIALEMIADAEKRGLINQETVLIEPTSGNTGVGLALVAAARGYRLILTMPDSMSSERKMLLGAYGAQIELTAGALGMKGAILRAQELQKEIKNSLILGQFDNPSNPEAHRRTTALEIINDSDGEIGFLVAGVGTGGSITGIGQVLKEKWPQLKIIAVEPSASAVLSGSQPGPHKIQGIGAGFIPLVLDQALLDGIIQVDAEKAYQAAREMATKEGILVGISAGAAVSAALELARNVENKGKRILVILPDTGERYLSTELFNQ